MSVRGGVTDVNLSKADIPYANIPQATNKPAYNHVHALLSQAAYHPTTFQKQTKALGYQIDKTISNRNRTLYYSKSQNKAILAYKGTSFPNSTDLAADAGIGIGLHPKLIGRFRAADAAYKSASSKYTNLEVTGHSLGGSQAMYIGRKYGAKGTAFEPGSGFVDAASRAEDDLSHGKLRYLPVNAIHNAVQKAMGGGKRSRVQLVSSAYRPKRVNTAHDAFTQGEYAVAALTRLPGHEKRTYIRPKLSDNHDIRNFV